jgi:hypothetical protein
MRGYGDTERPEPIDQYTLLHLVSDMVGLLDALSVKTAVIVGHDWAPLSHGTRRCCARIAFGVWLGLAFRLYLVGKFIRAQTYRTQKTQFSIRIIFRLLVSPNRNSSVTSVPTVRSLLYSSSADVGSPAITPGAGVVGMVSRQAGLLVKMVDLLLCPAGFRRPKPTSTLSSFRGAALAAA